MPVSDSSSLIYLAKTRRLHLLKDLYGSIKIPPSVYDEVVVEGEKRGFEDALRVKEVIEKYLTIDRPEEELLEEVKKKADSLGLRLGKGEIEGIALCINTKDKIFLSDDEDAKELTGNYGIEGKGTIYVLVKSYKMCLLEKKKCIEVFVVRYLCEKGIISMEDGWNFIEMIRERRTWGDNIIYRTAKTLWGREERRRL